MSDEIVIRRVFAAPRELVWAAWTDPAQLPRWWGRRGWNIDPATLVIDLRPGGVIRHESVEEATGARMTLEGVFEEVDEPERLVFSAPGSRSVVTFTDLGDRRTEMVFRSQTGLSDPTRRRAVAGIGSALDRLAEHLEHTHQEEHA